MPEGPEPLEPIAPIGFRGLGRFDFPRLRGLSRLRRFAGLGRTEQIVEPVFQPLQEVIVETRIHRICRLRIRRSRISGDRIGIVIYISVSAPCAGIGGVALLRVGGRRYFGLIVMPQGFSDKKAVIAPNLDGKVTMLLNTDWEPFGGNTKRRNCKEILETLPAFGGMLFSLTVKGT